MDDQSYGKNQTMEKPRESKNKLLIIILGFGVLVGGYIYLSQSVKPALDFSNSSNRSALPALNQALEAKFNTLSKNGNSSCSASFKQAVGSGSTGKDRLQGSCCSPMNIHRYSEQVEGLKQFKSVAGQNIDKIPDDPYDINAGLAKELMSYYDMKLNPEEQKAYDYAMQHSSEKGPCCCKCWRWNTYGGLGKYVIRNHGFTGEQLTELWNLSDGCGGDNEHLNIIIHN